MERTRSAQHLYRGFERFWHWSQAALVLFLMATGFEIHGVFGFFGFESAVRFHDAAAKAFLVLVAFAVFWHLTTGEWRQYLPTRRNVSAELHYYLVGLFRKAPHPTPKTASAKLNPLQRLAYGALKVLVIPLMVLSGLLYMFHRYPLGHGVGTLDVGLRTVALLHTAGAFILLSFLVAHVYLVTTGRTLTSSLREMLTGDEDLPGEMEPKEREARVEA